MQSYWKFYTCSLVVQLLSSVWLFVTPWTEAHQASLPFTISWSLLKLMSIESVMPSNHLILCHPHLLLPSIFPSIKVFSNDLALCTRWPKYLSFRFSISPWVLPNSLKFKFSSLNWQIFCPHVAFMMLLSSVKEAWQWWWTNVSESHFAHN